MIKVVVECGMRLHFLVCAGGYTRRISLNLSNKEVVLMHILRSLRWRLKTSGGSRLYMRRVELEADVEGEDARLFEDAVAALLKMRGLRGADVKRLLGMPVREACSEILVMPLLAR